MTGKDKYRRYLHDLGLLIKEYALETKAQRDSSKDEDRPFHTGMLLGYHAIVSLMQQQADAFGIGREELRLDDIKPDKDLT